MPAFLLGSGTATTAFGKLENKSGCSGSTNSKNNSNHHYYLKKKKKGVAGAGAGGQRNDSCKKDMLSYCCLENFSNLRI